MAEPKTKATEMPIETYIASIEHKTRQHDAQVLVELMQKISGEKPVVWGSSIIGFGSYHYQYDSGREGDWMKIGFSPRKNNMSLYLINGFSEYEYLLMQLGKYKIGKSCLYINKLADINISILKQMIKASYEYMSNKYD